MTIETKPVTSERSVGGITQSAEAVAELLRSIGRPQDPLPACVNFGPVLLVRNTKGDAYYCTSEKDCSCPARHYNPGQRCKHMRKYFPEEPKWATGGNGPVLPEDMAVNACEFDRIS